MGQIRDGNYFNAPTRILRLCFFLFHREGARYRPLGMMYLIVFTMMVATHAKVYYLSPIYPMLLAGGAFAIMARPRQSISTGRNTAFPGLCAHNSYRLWGLGGQTGNIAIILGGSGDRAKMHSVPKGGSMRLNDCFSRFQLFLQVSGLAKSSRQSYARTLEKFSCYLEYSNNCTGGTNDPKRRRNGVSCRLRGLWRKTQHGFAAPTYTQKVFWLAERRKGDPAKKQMLILKQGGAP